MVPGATEVGRHGGGPGLDHWREAEHIFLSEDRETAFQEVLRIGAAEEYSLMPDEARRGGADNRLPLCGGRLSGGTRDGAHGVSRFTWETKRRPNGSTFDHDFDPAERRRRKPILDLLLPVAPAYATP